jgi:hypothetical protein
MEWVALLMLLVLFAVIVLTSLIDTRCHVCGSFWPKHVRDIEVQPGVHAVKITCQRCGCGRMVQS